jgi:hypothetical protein
MNGFKIMGMADEGKCEHCGANCPKRRIYVMPVDADGNHDGEVQRWGVICASKARGNKGSASDAQHLAKFARHIDRVRAVAELTGNYADVRRACYYPMELRDGMVRIFSGLNRSCNVPDAEFPMPVLAG